MELSIFITKIVSSQHLTVSKNKFFEVILVYFCSTVIQGFLKELATSIQVFIQQSYSSVLWQVQALGLTMGMEMGTR